jgi:tetratricopeptide (TPR) repeat protein
VSPQNSQAALTALNGVRPVLTHFETSRNAEDLAADIIDLWTGTETSLQSLVGNSSLTGQQLVRAARQAELITLDQAHSLLEFLAARDRANRTSYKPTQADGDAALEGFRALESALTGKAPVTRATPSSPLQAVYTPRGSQQQRQSPVPQPPPSPYAPPSAGGGYRQPSAYTTGRKMSGPPTIEQPPPGSFTPPSGSGPVSSGGVGRSNVEHALAAAQSRSRMPKLSMPILIGAGVLLVIIVGIWYAFRGGGSGGDSMTAGIAAYTTGQREKARGEFAKAAKDNPNAARPHVYLARISRDEGDLASARAQLDTALRLEPKNELALREMGLVLFSTKQYDLARRFFVRAVQADPQDRSAQGYLGCALMRLGRSQEGGNFISKAGNGSWQSCLQPVTSTAPPPL